IFFLLESNPGPGLGVLLAYVLKTSGEKRKGAKMAASIHILGGIHEVYFSYVLKNLRLILPLILGGMVGTFTFQLFHVGLVSISSPCSVFLVAGLAPKEDIIPVLLGVVLSMLVSFMVSVCFIKKSSVSPTFNDTEETVKQFFNITKGGEHVQSSHSHSK